MAQPLHQAGWIAGAYGELLRTTDGGNTWISQRDEKYDFRSIYFVDENAGWVVGEQGVIFHTKNGGADWHRQNQNDSLLLSSVYAINTQTAFAVGSIIKGLSIFNRVGIILRTRNGGQNWDKQIFDTLLGLNSVVFVNDSVGWISEANGILLKTVDNGNSWNKIVMDSSIARATGKIQFLDENIGWIGGTLKTLDGGQSWQTQTIPLTSLNSFYYVNADVGWAIATYNGRENIIKTMDGGSSWTPCGMTPTGYNYLTQKSIIIKTTDGGTS